jgi:hypothetical protein
MVAELCPSRNLKADEERCSPEIKTEVPALSERKIPITLYYKIIYV